MSGSWLVTGSDVIFKVTDVMTSVDFYGRLGFDVSLHDDTYAFAHRDRDLTIHLAQAVDGDVPGQGSLYLLCQDADRVADDWRAAGVAVDGPRDEDYSRRVGAVADPDGNTIRFGSPLR
jgi:catechol 2,3-dioxygenase-like lactoylglutathione lyase family enzyme